MDLLLRVTTVVLTRRKVIRFMSDTRFENPGLASTSSF